MIVLNIITKLVGHHSYDLDGDFIDDLGLDHKELNALLKEIEEELNIKISTFEAEDLTTPMKLLRLTTNKENEKI